MARRASSRSGPRPILCAVLDLRALDPGPEARALRLFRAGVDWIQLRDREATTASLLQAASAVIRAREACSQDAARDPERVAPRVIVNRRVDVAVAAGADGVHLGFDGMAPEAARALMGTRPGARTLIGASLHGADEVLALARGGGTSGREGDCDRIRTPGPPPRREKDADSPCWGVSSSVPSSRSDYVHLAPIWDPLSKPASRPPLGLGELERACAAGLPVLAQGGLDPDRAARALAAGAAGVAVTGQVVRNADPADLVRRLRGALDRASP